MSTRMMKRVTVVTSQCARTTVIIRERIILTYGAGGVDNCLCSSYSFRCVVVHVHKLSATQ